ncbi:hypothetical protein [Kineobactrum salinum]|uniref:Uncharacterized protein n=1 Tax=Kineobactrum salinum TaxID=2708301 RepID=A0A6C0U3X8_9GAMM|nr:hypothetical protein [Kineobactrum salinum]QIB66736.1 hypothetical protein G3T16_16375 [Kineobactrum salinum]
MTRAPTCRPHIQSLLAGQVVEFDPYLVGPRGIPATLALTLLETVPRRLQAVTWPASTRSIARASSEILTQVQADTDSRANTSSEESRQVDR